MSHKIMILQVIEWSCEDVCEWLVEQGLAEYSHNFRTHAIDGREFMSVTDEVLENKLGVGKCIAILKWKGVHIAFDSVFH